MKIMQARDMMEWRVAGIHPKASLSQAVELMAEIEVGALLVIDISGVLVGMLTAGDILRRSHAYAPAIPAPGAFHEALAFGVKPGWCLNALEQMVEAIMTPELCTVQEDADLDEVAALVKRRAIRRLPVLKGDKLTGIIYGDQLLAALGEDFDDESSDSTPQESAIKAAVLDALHSFKWTAAPLIDVTVAGGKVELQGLLLKAEERPALCRAIETIQGVTRYRDHLVLADVPHDMIPGFAEEMVRRQKLYC